MLQSPQFDSRVRIAFISTMASFPWGGSEELWSRTALAALGQHHTVFASVYEREPLTASLRQLRAEGVELHLRPLYLPGLFVRLTRRIQTLFGMIKPLEKALTSFRPDLICISQGGNLDVAQMGWLRTYLLNCGFPFCIICHNYDANHLPGASERQAASELFAKARRVFFVSNEQAHVTQRQLARIFSNVELVKNPVNLPQTVRLSWPTNPIAQLAIVAGLDIDRKGHDIALEVLSQPHWRDRNWHLNIYGEGPDKVYIEDLLTLYGLVDRVTLHGNVKDIVGIWQQNHLLLMPSRREAAPLVVMEAMLCGRPVVATAVGTIPEWIIPGESGFIAGAPTVKLFDEALKQAWDAQSTWPTMGQQAYSWAYANADLAAPTTFLSRLVELS
jgi:glycosyltransferase involved in cell wall biosynthesis